jgi:hypothetical protein
MDTETGRSSRLQRDPVVYSGEWWEKQTDEELRYLMRGSFRGGVAYDGAVAELDRRSQARQQKRDSRIAFWSMVAAVVAAIVSVAALFMR